MIQIFGRRSVKEMKDKFGIKRKECVVEDMKNVVINIVIAILLVISGFFLFPFGAHIDGDTGYYFAMAAQMASNGFTKISEPMASVGYPLLLNMARTIFNGDFLKGALFINVISFSMVFFILVKELKNTENENFSQLNHICAITLLFLILLKQYFNSSILYSAWVEAPFIAFSSLGLYFLGRSRKEVNNLNISALGSLIFFIAAWYCKYVGIVGIFVFFSVFGMFLILTERSYRFVILKFAALIIVFTVLITPGAIINYLRTGNVLGLMAIKNNPSSIIFIKFGITDTYLERVLEFFNNIFAHLSALFYLTTYPNLLVGIFFCLSVLAGFWIFRADIRRVNVSTSLIGKFFHINHIEWYIWGFAYISVMLIKLFGYGFSDQAMSRYASLLIPVVSLFIFDFIRKISPKKSHLVIILLIAIFAVSNVISMYINLPDYDRVPYKVYIDNRHNLRGYPQFKKMQQMLNGVESIYFLPRKYEWPIADKFYALFPCKEFYVARDWSFGAMYDKKIYPIPDFNIPYAVVSNYEMDDVLNFIRGKGNIIRAENILGFSICLVEPVVQYQKAPLINQMDRDQYLGHGFIAHGCR